VKIRVVVKKTGKYMNGFGFESTKYNGKIKNYL
jgi:hypothetical protein